MKHGRVKYTLTPQHVEQRKAIESSYSILRPRFYYQHFVLYNWKDTVTCNINVADIYYR